MGNLWFELTGEYYKSVKKLESTVTYTNFLFLNEYPAACCGWDGQETDLRKGAYSMLDD